jgi:uncharacterized membrane protein
MMTWDDYVHLAFTEIRLAGAGSPQVARRLTEVLEDLLVVAPPARRRPIADELALLRSAIEEGYREPADARFALAPDRQGVGMGPAHAVGEPWGGA